ncbi:MAG: hypothetical protein IJC29_05720, partial [Clostridia bacterium]|nr:hypothetical protein [Clostridia bacterium]
LEEWGEALEEYLEKGYVETSFSFFDDLMISYEVIKVGLVSETTDEAIDVAAPGTAVTAIFALILFAFLIQSVKRLVNGLIYYSNSNENLLLTYTELKTTQAIGENNSWAQTQGGFGVVVLAAFYFIPKGIAKLVSIEIGLEETLPNRYVVPLSGVSVIGYIVLALGVVSLVLEWMIKEKKKKLRLAIIKEDLQQAQEQQAQVTEQTQA